MEDNLFSDKEKKVQQVLKIISGESVASAQEIFDQCIQMMKDHSTITYTDEQIKTWRELREENIKFLKGTQPRT